jgi:hypothetical protein
VLGCMILLTAATTAFLAAQGLERASWWMAIVGAALSAFVLARDLMGRGSGQTKDESERPSQSQNVGPSTNRARDIDGDNTQLGSGNSNINIGRGRRA